MPEKNTNMNLLMEFLQDNGVIWDKELVEVLPACMNPDLSDTTYACYAIKDCKEGDVIAWIPRSSLLSSKTTAIADMIMEEGLASTLRPECSLALALMYELLADDESPWKGYLQSLPTNIMTPTTWNAKDKDLLRGTEVENTNKACTIHVWDDYQKIQRRFPSYSYSKYWTNVILVRSHMLRVDDYHHLAMVPFMNLLMKHDDDHHKGQARLDVSDGAGVCQSCGKNQIGNCPSCSVPYVKSGGDQQQLHLDDLEALEEAGVNFYNQHTSKDQDIYYRVVLTRGVKKGDMIRYDYGPYSSAEMLTRFGFCYTDNDLEHEKFSVSREMIFAVCVDTVRDVMRGKQRMTTVATKRASDHVRERFRFYCSKIQYLSLAFTSNYSILASIFGTNSYILPAIHDRYTAINGCYPDDLLVLLHIVFANDALFNSYQANIFVAVGDMRKYLGLIHGQEEGHHAINGKRVRPDPQVEHLQRLVFTACHRLSSRRRACYDEPGAYLPIPPEMDAYRRDHEQLEREEYYALTCRINEKRIIQKSMEHYRHLIDVCLEDEDALNYSNKKYRSN